MDKTLYQYYSKQKVQPTFAGFKNEKELQGYVETRKSVFYRLMLPHTFFKGKEVLEFGPDTGENSLVFANWGAGVTIVEPNVTSHDYIKEYFSRFNFENSLKKVSASSMLDFDTKNVFDVIDAEGFIYTIKPNSAWIKKAQSLLNLDGLFILSYMELYGSFIELLTKAVYYRVVLMGMPDNVETVQRLFSNKWDSIDHTRKFESWYMDVIKNPFVRKEYFIDSSSLIKDMRDDGFRIFSSWPNYREFNNAKWIKSPVNESEEIVLNVTVTEKNRLSNFLGVTYFPFGDATEINKNLDVLLSITDDLVDNWTVDACEKCEFSIDKIKSILISIENKASFFDEDSFKNSINILDMIKSIYSLMKLEKPDDLIKFCQNNKTFISSWGVPAHYAVFQRIC